MLFSFLKYLQPTHYFQLYRNDGSSVFPIPEHLPEALLDQVAPNPVFKSEKARVYDCSWQALQKGYIGPAATYKRFEKLPVIDEYTFIRLYFHPAWVLYVLLLRLCSFKNPVAEIKSWLQTRNIRRVPYLERPIHHPNWDNLPHPVSKKVTVIIPTLNRYTYLKDGLKDLELQTHTNFEVIVVDQSEPFQPDFYKQFSLHLRVIHQKERALWLARNTAIEKANSDLLLLYDDDSRVKKDWIENHLRCLDFFNADISSGVSISQSGAEVPANYAFFRVSDQLDTGNVLIKRAVFEAIGLFDRQFEKQRMGDGEFGLRAHLEGFLNISNPHAGRLHLKVGSGGLREMGSWDGFRPKKWLAPRPIPSVLYLFRNYYGKKRAIFSLLKTVPPSIMPYKFKKNKLMMVLGSLLSLLLFPLVLFQVLKSWSLASKKIKQGARIKKLSA
ncbi:glycosyltransferase family 2 protein [Marixanthomonas spongiae]|uniref:Glycosyl transferase family 2 n=1 Tax=Marixanthomonas spongiae TaxID=2174845 RepID=A0A2U0I619_9FLAO|nr:glycosyltransferase [Marixanthomonas spongiae]PVW16470.1 glycosyl transferase family 2 [Marixanthomonas spongiae]